jgi:large subunit ribosomal protein L12
MEVSGMEYIHAALVLHAAGKPVDEQGITNVLKAAGVDVDEARVKALVAALEGVNIDEAIKSAAIPVAAPTAAPTAPAEKPEEKPAEKKEEKKEEEKKEEEALSGLGALFG